MASSLPLPLGVPTPASPRLSAPTADNRTSPPSFSTATSSMLASRSPASIPSPASRHRRHQSDLGSTSVFEQAADHTKENATLELQIPESQQESEDSDAAPTGVVAQEQIVEPTVSALNIAIGSTSPGLRHSSAPSVHFPATLPVPVHEHSSHHHYSFHNHHYNHHHHPYSLHHHQNRSHYHHYHPHPNTPVSQHHTNQMFDIEPNTPLPSYPSSAHISRSSSMRSLIISLETATPSVNGSISNDQHDPNASPGNFGYRLGRRLDTLVADRTRAASGECNHPLRRGVPMPLPLPTLAAVGGDRSRRKQNKDDTTGSKLKNEVSNSTTADEEPEEDEEPPQLDPGAILSRMVESQLHKTYDSLQIINSQLEAFTTFSNARTLPSFDEGHDGQKHSQTVSTPTTTASTPAEELNQFVFQRETSDPQYLRQLTELNMRLLKNLQVSIRKVDKLACLIAEHQAGCGIEEEESDDEIFVPTRREGARRDSFSTIESEDEEQQQGDPKKSGKEKRLKRQRTITAVGRAFGIGKPKSSAPPSPVNTEKNSIQDQKADNDSGLNKMGNVSINEAKLSTEQPQAGRSWWGGRRKYSSTTTDKESTGQEKGFGLWRRTK